MINRYRVNARYVVDLNTIRQKARNDLVEAAYQAAVALVPNRVRRQFARYPESRRLEPKGTDSFAY